MNSWSLHSRHWNEQASGRHRLCPRGADQHSRLCSVSGGILQSNTIKTLMWFLNSVGKHWAPVNLGLCFLVLLECHTVVRGRSEHPFQIPQSPCSLHKTFVNLFAHQLGATGTGSQHAACTGCPVLEEG